MLVLDQADVSTLDGADEGPVLLLYILLHLTDLPPVVVQVLPIVLHLNVESSFLQVLLCTQKKKKKRIPLYTVSASS